MGVVAYCRSLSPNCVMMRRPEEGKSYFELFDFLLWKERATEHLSLMASFIMDGLARNDSLELFTKCEES